MLEKSESKSEKGLTIQGLAGETEAQALARVMTSPALQSACTLKEYINSPIKLDLDALVDTLLDQSKQVKGGNLDGIEQMLLIQSYTLDVIANYLFRRSKSQELLKQFEVQLKLGLRAQSQSRATLETLINMKRPRVGQINIENLAVLVCNFLEKQSPPNKLLEQKDGERLVPATLQEAVRVDPELATVGEQHRAKDT